MSESPLDRYGGRNDPRRLGELLGEVETKQPKVARSKKISAHQSSGTFQQVSGYRIIRKLAHGGQAVVYDARQLSTGRRVALKILRGGAFTDSSIRSRFDSEVQILASLRHPNIVQIIDRGNTADGSLFLVMDLIPGKPLDKFLNRFHSIHADGPPPADPSELLKLFLRIADAVNAAHVRGVIHRDLKPANIRVDERGEPHILDFGLARPALLRGVNEAGSVEEAAGSFLGSVPWASPEQAEGNEDNLDLRTDVYSLGVILYQMLTGEFPYDVTGPFQKVLKTIITTVPWPPNKPRNAKAVGGSSGLRSAPACLIHPTVESIVLKALAKRRDDRYQSAGDLARDVRNYLTTASALADITADRATLLAVLEASRAITNELDLEGILRQITSRAAALIKAEAASVQLYDADRQQLVFQAATGPVDKELLGMRFDAKLGIAGEALRTRRAVHTQNTKQNARFFVGIDRTTGFSTRSILAVPLIHGEQTVGVLEVLNPIDREHFGPADLDVLEIFANIAAASAAQTQALDLARHENRALLHGAQSMPVVGNSPAVKEMLRMCHAVATTMSPVLLLGEMGTEKELLAREIHAQSLRLDKPWLTLNCAAVHKDHLDNELFGSEMGGTAGATSGATAKPGLFELASGGTLFLSEIGATSPPSRRSCWALCKNASLSDLVARGKYHVTSG